MTMLERLDKTIDVRNDTDLRSWLADIQENEIDQRFYSRFERILIEKWHHEHEDIIGMIWLFGLKDNRFIEPLMTIAQQPEVYRPFDDELESTLRKCVHALKEIGTMESDLAVKKLVETGNANVKY